MTAPQSVAGPDTDPEEEPKPLLTLRDGMPRVIDTEPDLVRAVDELRAGSGPVALDAERASGYRYSGRAYLIQIRRAGSGTALVDPTGFPDLVPLDEAIGDSEWILHAATQDIPCLREVGMRPRSLFDTELAARLLGLPRVGLASLVEDLLGQRMRKEHSAADWSQRPLPESWLEYAALDVEMLVEIRDILALELEQAGKSEWARQEFDHLLDFEPTVRTDPWRRTSGVHKLRGRRALAAVRELWYARDAVAQRLDTTPGRLLPDSALIAAAKELPGSVRTLLDTPGFRGRGARRYRTEWFEAIERARALADHDLPSVARRSDGPPQARLWADRDPVAARRLTVAKDLVSALSQEHNVPVENLLTPDTLRRVLWTPPQPGPDDLPQAVGAALAARGARQWQIDLMTPVVVEAIASAGSD